MTQELTALTLAALLQVVQSGLMALPANLELGTAVTAGPRDDPDVLRRLTPRTARLVRALNNHFEALILFSIAVTVVTLGGKSSPVTEVCAWVYVAARAAYVPAYFFGLSPWRSAIWAIGFFATVAMLLATL